MTVNKLATGSVLLLLGAMALYAGGVIPDNTPTTREGWAQVPFTRYWFEAKQIADVKAERENLLRDIKTGTVIDQFGQPVTGPVAQVVFDERMKALNEQLAATQKVAP